MARARMSKTERRRMWGDFAFLAPQLILFISLTVLPFLWSAPILFTDQVTFQEDSLNFIELFTFARESPADRPNVIGLANFTRMFTDDSVNQDYFSGLRRTVTFTILNYVAVWAFGMTLALLIYEIGFKSGLFTIIYLPRMLSGVAVGFLATMLFAQSTGTVNLLLGELGIDARINIKVGAGTTVILPTFVGWRFAGFNLAIFLSGLLAIPYETVEAAIVDGASYVQRLVRVYFPQMVPSIIIATTFCLLGSFSVFDELMALGAYYGNQEARFLSIVFMSYAFGQRGLALGMTLAIETFVPLVILGVLLQRLQRRLQY